MNLIELLTRGEIEVKGRLPYSSNYSFLCKVAEPESQSDSQEELLAVYKPGSGERPLWDFPEGLYMREVAAYQLSNALGWDLVPETVLRSDGPFGEGSLQRFVDADFSFHYFILLEQPSFHDALRKVAVFDILANNTDRKGGHLLLDSDERIWAIDNGLSFHRISKLRTVVWDFAGEPISEELNREIERVAKSDPNIIGPLEPYLSGLEIEALASRAQHLIDTGILPEIGEDERPFPWPLI